MPGNATLCFDTGITEKSLQFCSSLALKIPSKIRCDILPEAKYGVVLIDFMEGKWAEWQSAHGFDLDALDVSLDMHKMACGTVFPMLEVLYGGDDGTAGMDLSCSGSAVYACTKNGSCYPVDICESNCR